jgi:hypothetical protein
MLNSKVVHFYYQFKGYFGLNFTVQFGRKKLCVPHQIHATKSILQHFPVIFDLLLQSQSVPKAYFKPFKAFPSTNDLFWSILKAISAYFVTFYSQNLFPEAFPKQFQSFSAFHGPIRTQKRPFSVQFGLKNGARRAPNPLATEPGSPNLQFCFCFKWCLPSRIQNSFFCYNLALKYCCF